MSKNNLSTKSDGKLSADFWKFWLGQTISTFGGSFTSFALPLIIFRLTGSAISLAITVAVATLPNLLFGLLIGAWVDRLDRKRFMLVINFAQAGVIATIPFLSFLGDNSTSTIYAVSFISSTLGLCFMTAQSAVLPNLVPGTDLVKANGRIQASFSTATAIGPVLAGVLVSVIPLEALLLVDALSFLIAAISLLVIRQNFGVTSERPKVGIRQDIAVGLHYIGTHPILRLIVILSALLNLVVSSRTAQIVLFAKEQLTANDTEVGLLFSATSVGIVICSLIAGTLRRYISFGQALLGSCILNGILTIALALTTSYWVALPLWALSMGMLIIYNINLAAFRQSIVASHLLGRVGSVLNVLSGIAIPTGALLGGLIIARTGSVAFLFGLSGILMMIVGLLFSFTAVGQSDKD